MNKVYDKKTYNKVLEISKKIVMKLSNTEFVQKVVFEDGNISIFGDHPWGDLVLSNGNLSICLLMAQFDKLFPDEEFDWIAHKYFLNLQKTLLENGMPTSNMDSVLEKKIQKAFTNIMKDRSTIVIAHRLSTIRQADQIIFLDEGKITGIGTHEQLYKNHKLYQEYIKAQFPRDKKKKKN